MSQSGLGSIIQFNIAVSLTRGAGLSPAHLGEEASSLLWPSKRRSKRRQKVLHLHAFTSAPARRLTQHALYRPSEMCQLSTASKQNIRVSLTPQDTDPQTQLPKLSLLSCLTTWSRSKQRAQRRAVPPERQLHPLRTKQHFPSTYASYNLVQSLRCEHRQRPKRQDAVQP